MPHHSVLQTTHVKVLVDRLGLELGDTLHLRPRTCPKSDDSQPGIIPVEVSLTKQPAQDPQQPPQQQQQQRQQGAAGAAAAAPPPAAPSPKACANCGATQTCAWMRNPADRSQHLCAACHQYSRRHNGQVRPQALWSKLPAKRSAEEAVDLPQPPHPEQQQPAKQPKLQQAAAAVKQEQPAAEVPVATPAGKQPAPVAEPASGGPSSAAAGAAPPPATATSSSLLAPDADWSLVYARLNELLHECGVPDEAAQVSVSRQTDHTFCSALCAQAHAGRAACVPALLCHPALPLGTSCYPTHPCRHAHLPALAPASAGLQASAAEQVGGGAAQSLCRGAGVRCRGEAGAGAALGGVHAGPAAGAAAGLGTAAAWRMATL